jgi:hypothetical protein
VVVVVVMHGDVVVVIRGGGGGGFMHGGCGVVMAWFRRVVVDNFGLGVCVGRLCRRVLYKGVVCVV